MTTSFEGEPATEHPSQRSSIPKDQRRFAFGATAMAACMVVATWWVAFFVHGVMLKIGASNHLFEVLVFGVAVLSFGLLIPAWRSVTRAQHASASLRASDVITARVAGAQARELGWVAYGYGAALLILLLFVLFVLVNNEAVGRTFFDLPLIGSSFGLVLEAFWLNVVIFCATEAIVLVWALVVAVARFAPGPAGRPIRLLSIAYIDGFRGLPAIITLYLVGFGLPLTGLPFLSNLPLTWLAVIALSLTYGAYNAEVYRAGIDSIHPSQISAARSLGLSYVKTLRFVVVPQAVRRMVPPLLNNFISLQKDTALVSVIGAIDAFNQAKIIASNEFNLSAVTTVAFLFVLITIPQARIVDRMLERDKLRRG
ncbi:amino acid ABC transporter permease [Acidihalobacter ferrooxydans]|uniref:Polar amino acid ABC transporter permease n=1 Tax=Acidihalobacter ferrooxydans TaxID=1765967 RepID=A0A1P8UDU2_9GAMM|nr:amino acid ABC transporter permease [Acidihalobacter ferrooxydans]APZ42037.1 polar amino acid ABC transporter permease [Acidihalobacter ferrooxydans]